MQPEIWSQLILVSISVKQLFALFCFLWVGSYKHETLRTLQSMQNSATAYCPIMRSSTWIARSTGQPATEALFTETCFVWLWTLLIAQSYPCQNTLMAEFQKEQCTRCTWEPCLGIKYLRAFIFPESTVNLLYMFSASHLRSLCAIDCSHGSWTRVLYVLITPRGYGMWIKLELGMRNLDALGIIRWICMHMKMLRQSSKRNFLLWFYLEFGDLEVMRSLEKVWLRCRARNAPYPPEILGLSWTEKK